MSDKRNEPTAEEIEREQAITRWNLYRVTKKRILNTFNDPRTLKPKYVFAPEVEAKCQRILRHAEETLRFLIPLASEEMYSDSYEPEPYKPTLAERLMWWRRMGITRQQPDGRC